MDDHVSERPKIIFLWFYPTKEEKHILDTEFLLKLTSRSLKSSLIISSFATSIASQASANVNNCSLFDLSRLSPSECFCCFAKKQKRNNQIDR